MRQIREQQNILVKFNLQCFQFSRLFRHFGLKGCNFFFFSILFLFS